MKCILLIQIIRIYIRTLFVDAKSSSINTFLLSSKREGFKVFVILLKVKSICEVVGY